MRNMWSAWTAGRSLRQASARNRVLVLTNLFPTPSSLNPEKHNTEDTENHRGPQRNRFAAFSRLYLPSSPISPQCSLWLFSVFSVLNSEKCDQKCMRRANISPASSTEKTKPENWE